jgi:putative membrane protein
MPAALAPLAPWEPLWPLIAVFALVLGLYLRGLFRRRRAWDAPGALAFIAGLAGMYVVMQTQFDYYAQYMFFIHRLQHLVLHHLGPFLIALGMPAAVLAAGAPRWLRTWLTRGAHNAVFRALYRWLQQPVIAGLLFVGLIYFWLLPAVHFDAMLSARNYWLMNLSMAADGLLFWWFMLDPRPPGATPVTRGIGLRILVLWAVMPPQIVLGAWIALSDHVIFDVYAVCGRAWPVSPLVDQQLGGLITWIPAAMMSVLATLVLLRLYFRNERCRRAGTHSQPDMETA